MIARTPSRTAAVAWTLATVAVWSLLAPASDTSAALPDIVLVMADDQGWGDMAYNGHPTLRTPHFDRAAAEGLRFDRFYAAAPVCSPTRASVMTGRHPNRMGVFKWGYPLRPQERTLAEVLRERGYATGHFGKWHLGSVRRKSPASPGAHGFDQWVSAPNFFDNDPILSHGGKAVSHRGESSIVTADLAISWMRQQVAAKSGDGVRKPFLAVVWFGSPHAPHRASPEDLTHYTREPRNRQNFLGEITGMDRAFGKIRSALRELGIRENTILWYTSDNGALARVGSTGGHRGNKGKIYEGGLLVPAILEWPARVPGPGVVKARCSTVDIYPTLLAATGAPADARGADRPLDGHSLLPWVLAPSDEVAKKTRSGPLGFWDYRARGISTPSAKWMSELLEAQRDGRDLDPHPSSRDAAKLPSPAVSDESFPGHSAWIRGDWKLHRIGGKNGVTWELYDLSEDPQESRDRAAAEAARVATMRTELEDWLRSVVASLNGRDYERNR